MYDAIQKKKLFLRIILEKCTRYSRFFYLGRWKCEVESVRDPVEKKKPVHLKRNPVTIRLPQFMILRLKRDGEIGYLIEEQLAKKIGELPEDYDINS